MTGRPSPPRSRRWEPPGLISPSGVFPSPEFDKLLLWTDMSNPDDDTDVPSGFNDDAEMERTSPRVSNMVTSSPAPASPGTLGAADEEDGFTVEDPPPAPPLLLLLLPMLLFVLPPQPPWWETFVTSPIPSLPPFSRA